MSDTPLADALKDHYCLSHLDWYNLCVDLERENAALRKDKERLDFWNANRDVRIGHSNKLCGSGINSPGWWWQLGRLHEHGGIKNIRDTLDSAIAWHKKPRGPKAGIHMNEETK